MGDQSKPLTDQEQQFCASYVLDRNGTRAAKEAGYSARSAAVLASRLLKRVNIQARIAEIDAKKLMALDISHERIKREMARIGFVDPRKLFNDDGTMKQPHELDDDTAAALASMDSEQIEAGEGNTVVLKRKAKLWNKLGALQDLAKITGLMKEGANVNIGLGLAIEIKL